MLETARERNKLIALWQALLVHYYAINFWAMEIFLEPWLR
jgi:hypothetical protein